MSGQGGHITFRCRRIRFSGSLEELVARCTTTMLGLEAVCTWVTQPWWDNTAQVEEKEGTGQSGMPSKIRYL
jgi:hypothetical protein